MIDDFLVLTVRLDSRREAWRVFADASRRADRNPWADSLCAALTHGASFDDAFMAADEGYAAPDMNLPHEEYYPAPATHGPGWELTGDFTRLEIYPQTNTVRVSGPPWSGGITRACAAHPALEAALGAEWARRDRDALRMYWSSIADRMLARHRRNTPPVTRNLVKM